MIHYTYMKGICMENILVNKIVAQIIGILAILIFALSPQQKTKQNVLIFQLISSILYGLQYFILGAFSAVVINIIGAIKEFWFYLYAKKESKIPLKILLIYIIAVIIAGMFTYTDIFSVFPTILAILMTYATWQKNLKNFRILSIISSTSWIIYNFVVCAYVNAIGNLFQLISAIIAVICLDIIKSTK